MVTTIYTPILRWREAEKKAIKDLSINIKDSLLPLFSFQYSTKNLKNNDLKTACSQMALSIPQEICLSWGDGRPFLADFDSIVPQSNKYSLFCDFMTNAAKLHLLPIPVVDPCDDPAYIKKAITLSPNSKLCLRLRGKDLSDANAIAGFCAKYHFQNKNNLTIVYDLLDNTTEKFFEDVLSSIDATPNINEYENVILAASSFPVDMSKITSENYIIPRTEWLNWKKHNHEPHVRYPSFADHTIRHPIYKPALEFHQATTTIKYTTNQTWLCLKGEINNYEKYLASANALIKMPEFCGESFSAGDHFIANKGNFLLQYIKDPSLKNTGNNTQWIYAGINHHITFVTNQLSNLGAKSE